MTWAETKAEMERLGVKDEDDIWYIDISYSPPFEARKDASLGWAISD